MKIMFMGTPEFAVPCLERLITDGHEVVLAVTQADKPKGRGYTLAPPPVKVCALSHKIPVFQPKTLKNNREAWARLSECAADLAIVVAYGKILPQQVLDIPKFGCINVHASLLPKYRGAAPIQWAVLNGETEAGVTTMQMDAGLDTGDMLLQRRVSVKPDMTSGELHDNLSLEGAKVLSDTVKSLEKGTLKPVAQQDNLSCYASMLSRELSPIDWNKCAADIHNQIRGLNPWPSATTRFNGKTLKIHRSRVSGNCDAQPGTVTLLNPLTIACGNHTSIEFIEVQYEGAKRMPAADFLRGHHIEIGKALPN